MPRDPAGHVVEAEFLTLPVWDRFDAAMTETVARTVERGLPEPWQFLEVIHRECGGQKRWVAYFDHAGAVYALIPGGAVTLGYDPAAPYHPPDGLLTEWERDARAYSEPGVVIDWQKYLTDILSPVRTVTLGPYLIAARAVPKTAATGKGERTRIRRAGFTLPTTDQWEFACSGGTRSLWYWGNNPLAGDSAGANAFGLHVVLNAYEQEALAEPGEYRGGDGGVREHGGANDLEAALPLSSWYRSPGSDNLEDWWQFTRYRRVYPLPPEMLG